MICFLYMFYNNELLFFSWLYPVNVSICFFFNRLMNIPDVSNNQAWSAPVDITSSCVWYESVCDFKSTWGWYLWKCDARPATRYRRKSCY